MLTIKLLEKMEACSSGIEFVKRNNLIGFPLSRIDEVHGDYSGFVDWLKYALSVVYEYDERGNVTKTTYNDNDVLLCEYDERNNMIKSTDHDDEVRLYRYDERSNTVEEKSLETGSIWWYEYDERNNLVKEKSLETGSIWWYEYDERNNLVKEIRSNGAVYMWEYDERGNNTKAIYPSGKVFLKFYDDHNNVVKSIDRHGIWLRYYTYHDTGTLHQVFSEGRVILTIPKF